MNRYHIKIGFKEADILKLKEFTCQLNTLNWQYSEHCLDNLKHRVLDIKEILLFIKNNILNYNQVFEYYSDGEKIIKVCYRINFNNAIDLILVLNADKKIITIYLNSKDDEHYTLKNELYNRVDKV